MPLRWVLAGWFLFTWTGCAFGQQQVIISGKSIVELRRETSRLSIPSLRGVSPKKSFQKQLSGPLSAPPPNLTRLFEKELAAPSFYSYGDLGLFCKFEVQLERMARFPIKLRLGDVPYVDRLEGKRVY